MILVTGASGNVGGELVKALTAAGAPFRAVYHSPEKAAKARASGADAVAADFARPDTLRPALTGIEKVFLVSPAGPALPELEGNVVEEARKAGVKRIVKSSVWRASEESYTFARWNRQAEKKVEASGIPFTHLRPNAFMQNFVNSFAASIRDQGAFYLPAGHAKVSPIDVRDIAAVAARVLTEDGHEGRAYDLSGPEALNYHQIANIFSVVLGKKVAYLDVPDEDFKKSLLGFGVPGGMADALIDLQHYAKEGQAADVLASVQQILRRKPISFEKFVRDHAAAFK